MAWAPYIYRYNESPNIISTSDIEFLFSKSSELKDEMEPTSSTHIGKVIVIKDVVYHIGQLSTSWTHVLRLHTSDSRCVIMFQIWYFIACSVPVSCYLIFTHSSRVHKTCFICTYNNLLFPYNCCEAPTMGMLSSAEYILYTTWYSSLTLGELGVVRLGGLCESKMWERTRDV